MKQDAKNLFLYSKAIKNPKKNIDKGRGTSLCMDNIPDNQGRHKAVEVPWSGATHKVDAFKLVILNTVIYQSF